MLYFKQLKTPSNCNYEGYFIRAGSPNSYETALAASEVELWQHRLAHIRPVDIKSNQNSHAVHGLGISSDISKPKVCSGCALGKAHRIAVPQKSHSRSTKLLQLIHSYVSGPIEVPRLGGSRYFVTSIDDFLAGLPCTQSKQNLKI